MLEIDSVVSVLGSLRLATAHGAPAEWVIARMLSGELVPIAAEDRHLLPPRLLGVLSNHEVAGGNTLELDARSVHFFEIELLEQSPDAPGLDDAVHVYGALSGPFPPRPEAPSTVRLGQLTVTRADLLAGLCRGTGSAFLLPPADGTTKQARAVSAVLPGDRDASIQAGEGIVVAIPLLPREMAMSDASNEMIVSQLVHDLLAMLRDDARATHPQHPIAQLDLPVPSRAALEARLENEGWSIQGDIAVEKPAEKKGMAGVLASVLHPLAAERRVLPRQASLDEFVSLAEQVLPAIPGWPGGRARALASRMRFVPSAALRGPTKDAHVPRAPAPHEPAPNSPLRPPEGRAPRPRASTPRDEWMKDFVSGSTSRKAIAKEMPRPAAQPASSAKPQPAPSAKPRLSPTSKAASPSAIPDWMRDFDTDDHDD